jgi:prepilin-type processing-associated H-X9-DG protein
MDENLLGYLVNALDPDTHRQVEAHLRSNPEAQHHADLLRRALRPLAADAAEEVPPPGLWVRTLGHIAHDQVRRRRPEGPPAAARPAARPLPRAPWTPGEAGPGGSWWRRTDVLVAALVLFAVLSMGVTALPGLWQRQQIEACQNNLRLFGQALTAYSQHHDHDFPKVEAEPPRNVAGIFVPILHDAGVLRGDATVSCPGNGNRPAPALTLTDLEELSRTNQQQFRDTVRRLAGCYAYTLGYGAPDGLHGLRDDDGGGLPIMSDRPDWVDGLLGDGNSPNHGGRGQNVLYIDGHVRFSTTRGAGVGGDDIYVNQRRKVEAGVNRLDSVLGASPATPYPPED